MHGTPVSEVVVLASLQQILMSPEVRMLIEDPGPIQNITGLYLMVTEAVIERGPVLTALHNLTLKVRPLIQTDTENASMLQKREWIATYHYNALISYRPFTVERAESYLESPKIILNY